MKIPTLRRTLSVLLIFIALIAAYQAGFIAASPSGGQTATINQWAMEKACTYQIFTDGTYTYAQNCDTGAIDYGGPSNLGGATGTLPETVINLAVTQGGKIFIKAGTYTFTTTPINLSGEGSGSVAAIGTTSVSNVELFGEVNSTILVGGSALTGSPQLIGVLNANNWYIHDLQIDGNSEHQSGTTFSDGIVLWNSNNSTIQQVYVHDNKNVGIDTELSTSIKILNNRIKNSYANGIQVTAGSDILIQGNTVDGSSDVGISISGNNAYSGSAPIMNVICIGNTLKHLSLGVSPYNSNAAMGIDIGDNGYAQHVLVSGNMIYGPGNDGIEANPGLGTDLDITVSNNQINATTNQAIYGTATSGLLVEGNVLDYPGTEAILISTAGNVSVSGNYIRANNNNGILIYSAKTLVQGNYVEGGGTGIQTSGQWTNIVGNTVTDSLYAGLDLESGSDDSLAVGNYVYALSAQAGMYIYSKDDVVSNNRFYSGGNTGAIVIESGAVGTVVSDNDVRNDSWGLIQDSGTSTTIVGNIGYNPVGHIVSPFASASETIIDNGPYNRGVDSGGSSTPVNATTMTVWESPKIISVLISSAFTTGHTFVLQIDGTQIVSTSAPTAQIIPYVFTLQPGQTFYCQYQTGKVTFIVSGE